MNEPEPCPFCRVARGFPHLEYCRYGKPNPANVATRKLIANDYIRESEQRAEAAEARVAELEADAALGRAINRAATELPDGAEILIEIERGAGTVHLLFNDNDTLMDVDADDRLTAEINAAIDAAIASAEKGKP